MLTSLIHTNGSPTSDVTMTAVTFYKVAASLNTGLSLSVHSVCLPSLMRSCLRTSSWCRLGDN